MSKPKVLIFIDWFLPGTNAGGPVRSCANLIEHLSDQITFSVITTDTDYTAVEPYPKVRSDQWTTFENGVRVWYCSKGWLNKKIFKKLIEEQEYDAYYINGLYSKYFSILPLQLFKKKKEKRKVIVAVRGMLAQGPMRYGTLKKKSFIRMAKLTGLYNGVIFQATNNEEKEDIRHHIGGGSRVELIPNLPRKVDPKNSAIQKKAGELKVLMLARIALEKNTAFVLERIANVQGEVHLDLCGVVYDEDYWSKCQILIDGLPSNISVGHIEGVKDGPVSEFIEQYHLLFLPTLGENFGHVIFESLSAGRPVIISDRTPWQGLEVDHAGFVLPLEEEIEFEKALQKFTDMQQSEYDKWRMGAFEYAFRYLEQDGSAKKYIELFTP